MNYKNLLLTILSALLPVVYSIFIDLVPSFPLSNVAFVELIVWLVGMVIGGWNACTFNRVRKMYKSGLI